MKNYLLLILAVSILSACEKENLDLNQVDEIDAVAQAESNDDGTTESGFRRGGVTSGAYYEYVVENMTTCNDLRRATLPTMTNASAWQGGNNTQAGFIDYDLEQAFNCDPVFSGCTYRPSGMLLEQEIVEYDLLDEGHSVFDPNLGFITGFYLDNSITALEAEALKEHFACEILNTQPSRPNTIGKITSVVFESDGLLCNTCARYLRATVTFSFYAQGPIGQF